MENKEQCPKCEGTECTCNKSIEPKVEKPFEEKNIVERHLAEDGKTLKIVNLLLEQEAINKDLILRVAGLEEAMQFFSEWYNKTQRVDILVPENFDKPKIIL